MPFTKQQWPDRFWIKVDKNGSIPEHRPELGPCWIWTVGLDVGGYGQVKIGSRTDGTRRNVAAHRVAYELLIGPISDGLTLDHLCHDPDACRLDKECPHRRCVNPAHLEPVTKGENTLRGATFSGFNARKTHCMRGHEFTSENTYRDPKGRRQCRACRADRGQRRQEAVRL